MYGDHAGEFECGSWLVAMSISCEAWANTKLLSFYLNRR